MKNLIFLFVVLFSISLSAQNYINVQNNNSNPQVNTNNNDVSQVQQVNNSDQIIQQNYNPINQQKEQYRSSSSPNKHLIRVSSSGSGGKKQKKAGFIKKCSRKINTVIYKSKGKKKFRHRSHKSKKSILRCFN